jgi:K+ channel tetramerisation domain.
MEGGNGSKNSEGKATTSIVTFNVGGTRYQVSRSLLDQFPHSMLSKSASKQWQEDRESEIFIERNGVRFQYVLDYMRDGKVGLPVSQTKTSILAELEYFGIDVADKTVGDCSKTIAMRGITYAHLVTNQLQELRRELDEDIRGKNLASWVLKSILERRIDSLQGGNWSFRISIQDNEDIHTALGRRNARDEADAILNKVGLHIKRFKSSSTGSTLKLAQIPSIE